MRRLYLAALVGAAMLMPTAAALTMTVEPAAVELDPRGMADIAVRIANDDAIARTVTLTAAAPADYQVIIPPSFNVGPGASQTVTMTLRAEPSAVAGTEPLRIDALAVATLPGAPDISQSATVPVTMTATYADSFAAPLRTYWPWFFAAIGGGLAIAAAVLFMRHGVRVDAPARVHIEAGTHATVPVAVRARGAHAERVHLHAAALPGWKVRIEPQEVRVRPGTKATARIEVDAPAWAFRTAMVRIEADGARHDEALLALAPK